MNNSHQLLEEALSIMKSTAQEESKKAELLKLRCGDIYLDIFIDSYLINQGYDQNLLDGLFDRIMASEVLSYKTVYYLVGQIYAFVFRKSEYESTHNLGRIQKLLEKSLELCKQELNMDLSRIPEEELNGNVQVVITQQFLSGMHGPTTVALDRCVAIKNHYPEVFLINTADSMSMAGECLFWDHIIPNYFDERLNESFQEWKNVKIPFFQCEKGSMPDVEVIRLLLQQIISLRPKVVVSIGGGGLLEGLVNLCIPTLAVGLSNPGPSFSLCDYQTVGDINNETVKSRIKEMGFNPGKMIETRFTYSLRGKSVVYSKKDLNIPDDNRPVIITVGWRLDYEMTEEFLNVLNILNEKRNAFFVFVGKYNPSDEVINKFRNVFDNALLTGPQQELVSIMENCDIYLNPYRSGGGTSAVEAMNAKIPVLSLDYGDVGALIPKEIRCNDYEEMTGRALKMMDDATYYSEMVNSEYENIQLYLDSDKEFFRVLNEYISKRREN